MTNEFETESLAEELAIYQRGQQLARIVRDPAWQIVVDTIQSYADNADADLRRLPPGDSTVPTAHAVVFALDDLAKKFNFDVQNAVNLQPSDELKAYIRALRKAASPMQPV
jgi:hypothetical protein